MEHIKRKYSYFHNEDLLSQLLIFITVLSWFAFPLILKPFGPSLYNWSVSVAVAVAVAVGLVWSAFLWKRNVLDLQPLHKVLLLSWLAYLLALLLSTLESASAYSLTQWALLTVKFLFFVFLILYLKPQFIFTTFRLYSNLMTTTVVLAFVAVCCVIMGIHPLAMMDVGGRETEVYFGSYYTLNTSIFMPHSIYRIQGLSEEPGTYAFALLPAFFWLLIVEKAYIRTAIIVLGLMFSMSLGAGILLLLLLPFMLRKYFKEDLKIPVFIFSAVCAIGLMYVVSGAWLENYMQQVDDSVIIKMSQVDMKEGGVDKVASKTLLKKSLSVSPSGKISSLQDRIDGSYVALNYLKNHLTGTGAALGMSTVNNSISVGYVVAILEAGIVGGLFYICLFAIMAWLALSMFINSNDNSIESRVRHAVSLSICTVLFMGAQRIQPDLSFWHMWIYASLFYLTSSSNNFDQMEFSSSEEKQTETEQSSLAY